MFTILENGQVMKQEKGDNYELWTPIGMKNEVIILEEVSKRIYQWQVFDLKQGKYVDDTSNTTPIIIDGVEHTPTNGRVEVEIR